MPDGKATLVRFVICARRGLLVVTGNMRRDVTFLIQIEPTVMTKKSVAAITNHVLTDLAI